MTEHIKHHISSKHCSHCGGEGEGMKCPKCGKSSGHYDPFHWKECMGGGKFRVKCKACGQSEDHCSCI
ncbi:MAG: hypothetical protein HYT98_00785 [Candidatus Sungbacteria bacterium]|nr:hypothetical protein [Candidatus Sungbacteria bacterium]